MKKRLVLLVVISILLTGCGSDAKIKELESRIEKLEQRVGITNEASNVSESGSSTSLTSTEKHNQDASVEFTYKIGEMNASQVFDELCYYFENLPYEGESREEVEQCLKVTPCSKFYSRFSFISSCEANSAGVDSYMYSTKVMSEIQEDCIAGIEFRADERMDGKVYDGKYVEVSLIIKDFDKASELYYKLLNYLEPKFDPLAGSEDPSLHGINCIHDEKGTTWWAQGSLSAQFNAETVRYLSLEKYGDWYFLYVAGR